MIKKDYQEYRQPQYIANGLSHLHVMRSNLNSDKDLHILEDDLHFAKDIKKYLSKVIMALENSDWDILFTDVIFALDYKLLELEKYFDSSQKGKLALIDLKDYMFVGTASYIINKKSISKIYNMFNNYPSFGDIAFNIQLSQAIRNHQLKAMVTIPFLTKTSMESQLSTLEERNITWDIASELLREFFFIDEQESNHQNLLEYLEGVKVDKRKKLLLDILRYKSSDEYQPV